MGAARGPLDVLVVGWYPGADDPIAGRFIADQALALAATGRVRPVVASFEPFWLHGGRGIRSQAADAWPRAVEAAARSGLVPASAGAFGGHGVPVARLGTPVGTTPRAGPDNEAVHREAALLAAVRGMGRPVDIIHAHVGYPEGAAAARVAAKLGVPFVMTEHASYLARIFAEPALRGRYREAGLAAQRIVAVGRMIAAEIAAELPELADRIVVIPNTVDVAAFTAVGPDRRDGDELLWVGYRREVKGTGVLLRAFAQVRTLRPATTLRLVGRSTTDDEEQGWHRLAAELGVADAVRFDPPTDRAGVATAMTRSAVFVHPSPRETFGLVAAEALATGLPVVAADSGGVTEVLGDDPDGLGALVPANDPAALAAAILRVLDRRASYDPARLRAHVGTRYAAPVVAGRIADLYDEVLATSGAGGRSRPELLGERGRPEARVGRRRPEAPGELLPAGVPRLPAHPVLVAFDRPALDRLVARCPAWLLKGLVVVTRGEPVLGAMTTVAISPGLEPDLTGLLGWRSAGSPFPSPIRWLVRALRRTRIQARVLPALTEAVERGLAAAGRDEASDVRLRPLVLCLGGIDVVAAGPLVRRGRAVFAPGGLRWLGDVRWAGGPAGDERSAGDESGPGDQSAPDDASAPGDQPAPDDAFAPGDQPAPPDGAAASSA